MAKASKAKQLTFVTPNEVGILARVSTAIAGVKVNINALCAYAMEDKAHFMMLTESNVRTRRALTKAGFKVGEESVVIVEMPNRAGEMQKVASKISAAGVDIIYAYGTAGSGRSTFCVFKTNKDAKAIRAINK